MIRTVRNRNDYEFLKVRSNSQYRYTATATSKHSSPNSSTKTSSQVCRPIPLQKAESASFPLMYWAMVVVLIHPRTVCWKKSLSRQVLIPVHLVGIPTAARSRVSTIYRVVPGTCTGLPKGKSRARPLITIPRGSRAQIHQCDHGETQRSRVSPWCGT